MNNHSCESGPRVQQKPHTPLVRRPPDSGYNTRLRMRMLKRGLMLGLVVSLTLVGSAPWAVSAEQGAEETRVPAFQPGPLPKGEALPRIVGRDQLWGEYEQYAFQT